MKAVLIYSLTTLAKHRGLEEMRAPEDENYIAIPKRRGLEFFVV